jgi:hypothetical protein
VLYPAELPVRAGSRGLRGCGLVGRREPSAGMLAAAGPSCSPCGGRTQALPRNAAISACQTWLTAPDPKTANAQVMIVCRARRRRRRRADQGVALAGGCLFAFQFSAANIMLQMHERDTVLGLSQDIHHNWHKSIGLVALLVAVRASAGAAERAAPGPGADAERTRPASSTAPSKYSTPPCS